MQKLPFKAALAAFDIKKIISGDAHLWMAIISVVRLVLHWSGESPIGSDASPDGSSEALTVWIIMAVWGILGIIRDVRAKKNDTSSGPPSAVAIVLLLGLLLPLSSCTQTKLLVKKAFRCSVACIKNCMAESVVETAIETVPTMIMKGPDND